MKTPSQPVLLAACTAAALLAGAASAQPATACLPQAESAWIRLTPAGMPMHAGFMRIRNNCPQPATFVKASSPAYAEVQLHRTEVVGGVSRMRHMPELAVPAKGAAELKPGGMHLMLMRPKQPVQVGDTVQVQLSTADGRTLTVPFTVRPVAPRR